MPALVEARGLTKIYATPRGPIHALDGVNFQVEPGEFVAIRGRSGSGKSTLLALVGGLCRPSGGTIQVDGVDLGTLAPGRLAEFRARRLGFMFQFAGLLPNLRAVDNIALAALLGGKCNQEAYKRAHGLLEQVGLGQRWDAYAGELSGGQQRRVALARALINDPVLILADEPTSDLDEQAETEILELIHRHRRASGNTLIVVTHDEALARQADRAIHLRSGRITSVEAFGLVPVRSSELPPLTQSTPAIPVQPFEPEPATLMAAVPTPLGTGLARFLVGFVGWVLVFVCSLYGINFTVARFQQQKLEARTETRKKSEELALQQLRADVSDVIARPDGNYELALYLENFHPETPFYVLGPKPRLFVQVNHSWQPITVSTGTGIEDVVHAITTKQTFSLSFRADLDRFDELIPGYMHMRISNVMVVGASANPTGDLFERDDDYYIYLKPHSLSEDEVRRRNGWKPGSIVPRWIAMPSH